MQTKKAKIIEVLRAAGLDPKFITIMTMVTTAVLATYTKQPRRTASYLDIKANNSEQEDYNEAVMRRREYCPNPSRNKKEMIQMQATFAKGMHEHEAR